MSPLTGKLKSKSNRWSTWSIILISFTYIYIVFNLSKFDHITDTMGWDKTGYYIYLPAVFIFHDVNHLSFYDSVQTKYHLNSGVKWYAIYDQPSTGNKLDKYPIGIAVLEMPFFLIAHVYTSVIGGVSDGYSKPYLVAFILSNVLWTLLGFVALRKFLLYYFNDSATAITLLLIAFGTNLYNYAAFDYGMSHNYSFALFSFLMLFTALWYKKEKVRFLYFMAMVAALIVVTRPTNVLILLFPFCWPYKQLLSDKICLAYHF
jgi:hypothetical protein